MSIIKKLKKAFLEKKTLNVFGEDYFIKSIKEYQSPLTYKMQLQYTFELTSISEQATISFTIEEKNRDTDE